MSRTEAEIRRENPELFRELPRNRPPWLRRAADALAGGVHAVNRAVEGALTMDSDRGLRGAARNKGREYKKYKDLKEINDYTAEDYIRLR